MSQLRKELLGVIDDYSCTYLVTKTISPLPPSAVRCKGKPAGYLQLNNRWALCEEHLKPKYHPAELRDQLHRFEEAKVHG